MRNLKKNKHYVKFIESSSHIIVFISFLIIHLLSCNPSDDFETRPNIVLIMADDLGYETIGANGGTSYQTPKIDKLAKNGIRFNHCYAQPLCTPSRVKLMTGIYNIRNYTQFGYLDESQSTIGNLFKNNGYATCITGKWQLGKNPESPVHFGFDNYCLWQHEEGRVDSNGRDTRYSQPVFNVDGELKTFMDTDYGPDILTDYVIKFIEKSHKSDKPFLLYYPMVLTHCPFSPTPDSPEWMKDDSSMMTYKGQARYFTDMVTKMDDLVGLIDDKLKELEIENNTLIIFTGDNGTDIPIVSFLNGRKVAGAKGETTDAGTRVPFIAKWTGVIQPNSVCDDLVDFSDILPTICETANISVPDSLNIDGRTFLPQLKGEKGDPRKWIYCWYSRSGKGEEAKVFARNHQYKLYENGQFYNIPNDYDETNSLNYETLTMEEQKTFQVLDSVLKYYNTRRMESIP